MEIEIVNTIIGLFAQIDVLQLKYDQLTAEQTQLGYYVIYAFIGMLIGIVITTAIPSSNNVITILGVVIAGVIVIACLLAGLFPLADERAEIVDDKREKWDEVKSLQKNLVMSMSCQELRYTLLANMAEPIKWFDSNIGEKYYYLNCETPLRDEVLKLQ